MPYRDVSHQDSNRHIQELEFHTVMDTAFELVAIIAKSGDVLYASPAHKKILAIDLNQCVGQSALLRVHSEDLPVIRTQLKRVFIRKENIDIEFRYLHGEGHYVNLSAKIGPVLDEGGYVSHVVIVATDVTLKTHKESLLEGQNKIFALIARDASIESILTEITQQVEALDVDVCCGLAVFYDNHVQHVAPSLPPQLQNFVNLMKKSDIVEEFLHEEVYVKDVISDPNWRRFRDRFVGHQFVTSWSQPIRTSDGTPLGLFILIYNKHVDHNCIDTELYKAYAQIAALAIERHHSKEAIEHVAYTDVLTRLPNNQGFLKVLQEDFQTWNTDVRRAIISIDLDRFRTINDTLGFSFGNCTLKEVANRLSDCIRECDLVCRAAGDQFIVLVDELPDHRVALDIAERILDSIKHVIIVDDHEIFTSASVGISYYPDNGTSADELVKHADEAMLNAKSQGRGTVSVYHPDISSKVSDRLALESDIRKAIENNEFVLHYQPKIDTVTGHIVGAEALIRWMHPSRGVVSPNEFIFVAEESGLIVEIGNWVIETVLQQLWIWKSHRNPLYPIAVNVSTRQLANPKFPIFIRNALRRYTVDPKWIELEITETAILTHEDVVRKTINELYEIGIKFALDDFGTGYSSLSLLTRFNISTIKIDRSFIEGLSQNDPTHESIVSSVVSLAQNLGKKVVAEGVETELQLQFLRLLKCDEVQGYFFSKPLSVENFEELLIKHNLCSHT